MKRYDYIYLGLHIVLFLATLLFFWLIGYYLSNYINENAEDIERWWTAINNFIGEKYNEFVDEYAPENKSDF